MQLVRCHSDPHSRSGGGQCQQSPSPLGSIGCEENVEWGLTSTGSRDPSASIPPDVLSDLEQDSCPVSVTDGDMWQHCWIRQFQSRIEMACHRVSVEGSCCSQGHQTPHRNPSRTGSQLWQTKTNWRETIQEEIVRVGRRRRLVIVLQDVPVAYPPSSSSRDDSATFLKSSHVRWDPVAATVKKVITG